MLEIVKETNKNIQIVSTTEHCRKSMKFEININDDKIVDFYIDINYDEKNEYTKYATEVLINNSLSLALDELTGEFYEVVGDNLFEGLDNVLPVEIFEKEITDLCEKILNKIQKFIEEEKIVVD